MRILSYCREAAYLNAATSGVYPAWFLGYYKFDITSWLRTQYSSHAVWCMSKSIASCALAQRLISRKYLDISRLKQLRDCSAMCLSYLGVIQICTNFIGTHEIFVTYCMFCNFRMKTENFAKPWYCSEKYFFRKSSALILLRKILFQEEFRVQFRVQEFRAQFSPIWKIL